MTAPVPSTPANGTVDRLLEPSLEDTTGLAETSLTDQPPLPDENALSRTPEVDQLLAQLRKKNREAASLRQRLAQAEALAQEAEAGLATAEADRNSLLAALARERVARQFNLPDELAERLRGDDEAAMAADAQQLSRALAGNMTAPRVDVGQGTRAVPDADPNSMFRRMARNAP